MIPFLHAVQSVYWQYGFRKGQNEDSRRVNTNAQ